MPVGFRQAFFVSALWVVQGKYPLLTFVRGGVFLCNDLCIESIDSQKG